MKPVGSDPGPGLVDPHALGEVLVGTYNLLRYHQRIGIRAYPDRERFASLLITRKDTSPPRSAVTTAPGSVTGSDLSVPCLEEVHAAIRQCCSCSGSHPGPFLPAGARDCSSAQLVVLGDWCRAASPSDAFWCDREEDEMLWRMMKAIDVQPDRAYVTNILKCPPAKGIADPGAVQKCLSHLQREIAAAGAPVVLAMGELATSALLGATQPLVRVRGRLHTKSCLGRRVLVMATFHPHFLLRHAEMKQPAWQDLLLVKRYLAENAR